MDALEAILTRRSVRRYTNEQIDDETTEKLLAAAMSAPSAANEQPWEFIVIRDRAMLDAIPTFSPFASMVKRAPLGILVCADTRNVIVPGFWVQDCSAATQNLLSLLARLDWEPYGPASIRWKGTWQDLPSTASSPKASFRWHLWWSAIRPKSRQHNIGLARTGSIQTCGDVTGAHRPDSGLALDRKPRFSRYVRSELS